MGGSFGGGGGGGGYLSFSARFVGSTNPQQIVSPPPPNEQKGEKGGPNAIPSDPLLGTTKSSEMLSAFVPFFALFRRMLCVSRTGEPRE